MSKLEIHIYGDPVLSQVARPIEKIEARHHALAADMIETMYAHKGIGLAANQVGVTERIVVVDVTWADRDGKKGRGRHPTVLIDPVVLEEGVRDAVSSEGCLSLPEIDGDVWRPTRIKVRYRGLDGAPVEREAAELEARCILHEIDHLNGILFIDRMAPDERRKLAGQLGKLRKSKVPQPA